MCRGSLQGGFEGWIQFLIHHDLVPIDHHGVYVAICQRGFDLIRFQRLGGDHDAELGRGGFHRVSQRRRALTDDPEHQFIGVSETEQLGDEGEGAEEDDANDGRDDERSIPHPLGYLTAGDEERGAHHSSSPSAVTTLRKRSASDGRALEKYFTRPASRAAASTV